MKKNTLHSEKLTPSIRRAHYQRPAFRIHLLKSRSSLLAGSGNEQSKPAQIEYEQQNWGE